MKKILAILAMIMASVININAYSVPSNEDVGVNCYVNRIWEDKCFVHIYIRIDYTKYVIESVKMIDTDGIYTQPLYPDWGHNTIERREYWTMDDYVSVLGYRPFGEIMGTRDFYVQTTLRDKAGNHYVYKDRSFIGYYGTKPRISKKK